MLRERIKDGYWQARHLAGKKLMADLLIKPIVSRLQWDYFMEFLDMVEPGASEEAEQEVKRHAKTVGCLAAICALACIKPRNHLEKVSRALGVAASVACLAETWVGRKFKDLSRANGPQTACLRSEASKGQHVETRAIEPIKDLSRAIGPQAACLRSEASKEQHVETRAKEPIKDPTRAKEPIKDPSRANEPKTACLQSRALLKHHVETLEVSREHEPGPRSFSPCLNGTPVNASPPLKPCPFVAVTPRLCAMSSRSLPRTAVSISGNPWDLEEFNELPGGRDRWEQAGFDTEGYEWWVRLHPKLLNRSYHPVHSSTPWSLERSTGERVTVIYHCPTFRWERTIRSDDWRNERSSSFGGVREWKGYTFFKLWPVVEHQRTSASTRGSSHEAEHREEDLSTRSYRTSEVAAASSRSRSSYGESSYSAPGGYGGSDPSTSRARQRGRDVMRNDAGGILPRSSRESLGDPRPPLPRSSRLHGSPQPPLPQGSEEPPGNQSTSLQLPIARDAPPSEFLEVAVEQVSSGSFELVGDDDSSW